MRCTPVGDEIIVTLTPCIRDTRPDPLTPREGEVLRWVAHGKTSREIANILGISPGTVRIHNERIRTKLDVRTRAQAVATGLSMGILELMESNGESPA
jgi:DNA-binding CsgD family transcriptional regulator